MTRKKNAVKQGLTGRGLALPVDDASQVEARFRALAEDLDPADEPDETLVRRAAVLSLRLEHCALYETAALSEAIRNACADFDDARRREVEDAIKRLPEEPMSSMRRLERTPEGLDWSIVAWEELANDLSQLGYWQFSQVTRAEQLMGRPADEPCSSRVNALAAAMNGDFRLLDAPGVPYPNDHGLVQARKEGARAGLLALIGAQLDRLRALRAALPLEDMARSRAEAPLRRLFDPSQSATLLRRYETAAARELLKIFAHFDTRPDDPDGRLRPELEPDELPSTFEEPTTCDELALPRKNKESAPADEASVALIEPIGPPPAAPPSALEGPRPPSAREIRGIAKSRSNTREEISLATEESFLRNTPDPRPAGCPRPTPYSGT